MIACCAHGGNAAVSPDELPHVEPRWQTRPLAPAEVVRLVIGEDVPGLNPHDDRVQAIRRLHLSNLGRLALGEAQRRGYLRYLADGTIGSMTSDVLDAWSWWCACRL
jgi:hypothetical protein